MRTARLTSITLAVLLAFVSGCGPLIYVGNVTPASRAVERARQADAARYAPYEFYLAEAYLQKAREEAGEAAYQDAIDYARLAESNADAALELTRERQREMGR